MQARQVLEKLKTKVRAPGDAQFLQRFFKTGTGQYGEGDVFIGVRMPQIREVCSGFGDIPVSEINELLDNRVHEVRMAALIIMANQCAAKKTNQARKKQLFDLYLKRTDRINNWDLVDVSCRDVVGGYLADKPRDILYKLARSKSLWERRIAMVSTWYFIRNHDTVDTFKIAEILLGDSQDLIHKASGWMLREAGKKDRAGLLKFLDTHAAIMPRTMLRYALEHLDAKQKSKYMNARAARV